MWKRAFIILICLELLVIVGGLFWLTSLPKASTPPPTTVGVGTPAKAAPVQVAIGEQAINTYLEYALSEQTDVQRVVSDIKVHFNDDWQVQLGVKLADKVAPFDLTFAPAVRGGNLQLYVKAATMGGIPIPPSLLFLVFRHLPWPNWIQTDAANNTLDVNFSERPQHPYGIKILSYSPDTRLLTLLVTIVPKDVLSH